MFNIVVFYVFAGLWLVLALAIAFRQGAVTAGMAGASRWVGSRLQTVSITDWRLWLVVAGLLAVLLACHRFLQPVDG